MWSYGDTGRGKPSDRGNNYFEIRYYIRLWTKSQPCGGFRTGSLAVTTQNQILKFIDVRKF